MSDVERRRLQGEIALVESSLADAAAEHAAGELDEASLAAITRRDEARLALLRAEVASLPAAVSATPPSALIEVERRGPRRGWLVGGGLVVLAGVVVLVVVLSTGGSPSTSTQITGLLTQASTLVEQGRVTEALPLYGKVLALDPTQPEALAQSGWLTFEAGSAASSTTLMAKGEAQVRLAAQVAPTLYAAHLYLGVIDLLAATDASGAIAEFQTFMNLKPPAYWINVATPYMEKAAAQAGVPVPTTTP